MGFGEHLKRVREEHGLSQDELARRVGAKGSHMSRYERGQVTPSADMLVKLAQVLEVSVDDLLFDGSEHDATAEKVLDRSMLSRLERLQHMESADKKLVLEFLDAFIAKRGMERILQ